MKDQGGRDLMADTKFKLAEVFRIKQGEGSLPDEIVPRQDWRSLVNPVRKVFAESYAEYVRFALSEGRQPVTEEDFKKLVNTDAPTVA
jgi:hypothetical protein